MTKEKGFLKSIEGSIDNALKKIEEIDKKQKQILDKIDENIKNATKGINSKGLLKESNEIEKSLISKGQEEDNNKEE